MIARRPSSRHSAPTSSYSSRASVHSRQADRVLHTAATFDRRAPTPLSYPNLPNARRKHGDFIDPSVMFGLSTRKHVNNLDHVMITRQKPCNTHVRLVRYTAWPEDTSFTGGNGYPVILDSLSENDKYAADKGVAEGFQLVSIDLARFPLSKTVESVEQECKDLLARNAEVTLGFVSPMDKEPPNLSDRQCSKRLGMDQVKAMHLTKVTEALREREETGKGVSLAEFRDILRLHGGMYWLEKQDIRILFRTIDQDSSDNVSLDEWEEALKSKFIMDDHAFQHLGKRITRFHIFAITRDLERRMMAIPNRKVNASQFCAALYSAGISWLTREQMNLMFDLIDEDRDGAISMAEWIARFKWSADEAVFEVQRFIDDNAKTREKQRKNGVASASKSWRIPKQMNRQQFSECLFYQGVRWLTQEQIECIFAKVDRDCDGQISADEWHQIKTLAFA